MGSVGEKEVLRFRWCFFGRGLNFYRDDLLRLNLFIFKRSWWSFFKYQDSTPTTFFRGQGNFLFRRITFWDFRSLFFTIDFLSRLRFWDSRALFHDQDPIFRRGLSTFLNRDATFLDQDNHFQNQDFKFCRDLFSTFRSRLFFS